MNSRHEIADAIFRRKTFILASSTSLLLAVGAAWHLTSGRYEAEMSLLVRNNRADVIVLPGQIPGAIRQTSVVECQIATEVQLLMSHNSLREVVKRCALTENGSKDAAAVDRAIVALLQAEQKDLNLRRLRDLEESQRQAGPQGRMLADGRVEELPTHRLFLQPQRGEAAKEVTAENRGFPLA